MPSSLIKAFVGSIKYGSIGTSSFIEYIGLDSIIKLGKFENTDDKINPFASKGEEGVTTDNPGTCENHVCKLFPCCGPCPQPLPTIALTVKGKKLFPLEL